MTKEVTIQNNKPKLLKSKLITLILCGLILYMFGSGIPTQFKVLNPTNVEAVIEKVETESSGTAYEGYCVVTATVNSKSSSYYAFQNPIENLAEGDTVTFTLAGSSYIYKIVKDSNVVYEIAEDDDTSYNVKTFHDQAIKNIILDIVVCVGVLVYLIYSFVSVLKLPNEEKHEYIEYALGQNNTVTCRMLPKTCKTRKHINLANYVMAGVIMVGLLTILAYSKVLSLAAPWPIIVFAIIGVVVAVAIIVFIVKMPHFGDKDAKEYADDYRAYLIDGPDGEYETSYQIIDGKLKYNSEHPREIDLEGLNLYVIGCYKQGFYGATLFVVSDRAELAANEYDSIIPLTHRIYHELLDNNVEVKNLDYVIEHLEEEIKKNATKGKKPTIVRYNEE